MRFHCDEETQIETEYVIDIDGIQVELNDSWCPGATISLYQRSRWVPRGRRLLYTKINCAKELLWTPPALTSLWNGIKIEYRADGYMRYEMLATEEEAAEIASGAVYDAQDEAHVAVTHTLSFGTSTVWLKVFRTRRYCSSLDIDVRFCVEFGNSEDCTRFIREDMRKLEDRGIYDVHSDVAVINDIMRALSPIHADHLSAEENAARRGLPLSGFLDGYPQPDTQLMPHRASDRGDDRPCFLTLHLSTRSFYYISRVDWSATNSPLTFPSPSSAFRSLDNLHLKFPSHASQHRNSPHQGDLTITISAREISFSAGTDSVALGNRFTVSSEHRTVTVNYINTIMGDAFLGTINGGNVGGWNNVNTIRISSPVGSRSPRLTGSLPRSRHTPLQPEQAESQGGVGRWVQRRSPRPRPYQNTYLRS